MRLSIATTSVAALLVLSVVRVAGQGGALNGAGAAAGDDSGSDEPVTYTTGGVVYSALIDADGDTVSAVPYSTIAATTAGTGGNGGGNAGGVSNENNKVESKDFINIAMKQSSPSQLLQFQQFERRSLDTFNPDQPKLEKRQAALGGGAGAVTTQTGLQTISGYNPPANTQVPTPTNFGSGTIISASQIPGYTGNENSQGVSGGGVSSGVSKLTVGKMALGVLSGVGIAFALI